jgi:hypothetical protein
LVSASLFEIKPTLSYSEHRRTVGFIDHSLSQFQRFGSVPPVLVLLTHSAIDRYVPVTPNPQRAASFPGHFE